MTPDDQQLAVLDALLAEVPAHGWTEAALRRALLVRGRPEHEAAWIFPNGSGEMIEVFGWAADRRMEEDAAADPEITTLRVPARVRAILALRFAHDRPRKLAIRRALAWLALPGHAPVAARLTARTVDAVWHAAGDQAADFSWYSKRGILAGVYGATLLYWLNDPSDDDAATLSFLDRRLGEVGMIGGAARRLGEWRRQAASLFRPPAP